MDPGPQNPRPPKGGLFHSRRETRPCPKATNPDLHDPVDSEVASTNPRNGGAEMFELTRDQYDMLKHHTKSCGCRDRESHDGLCEVSCVEVHGFPPRCRNCGDRHCPDHAENCEEESG